MLQTFRKFTALVSLLLLASVISLAFVHDFPHHYLLPGLNAEEQAGHSDNCASGHDCQDCQICKIGGSLLGICSSLPTGTCHSPVHCRHQIDAVQRHDSVIFATATRSPPILL